MQSRFMQLNHLQTQYRMTASVIVVSLVAAIIGTQINISNGASAHIDIENFAVGDCVEVHYTAPTVRATINLMSKNNDFVLHCDYRVNYYSQVDTLLLNTKLAAEYWNSNTRLLVPGVESTNGTTLQFVICPVATNSISVTLNSKVLATYNNSKMDITTVSRVSFENYGMDAKLQNICLNYP